MGFQPLAQTVVDLDMIGSGRLANDPLMLAARSDIRRITAATLAQQGIDFSALPRHDLGDGLRLIVPGVVSPAAVVDPFIKNLDAALRLHRERLSPVARLRLRVAIHHGLVHQDEVPAGEPMRVVARLLDAAPVRRAAELAPDANLVVVVSEVMYDSVVRHGYGLDPRLFQHIAIAEKEMVSTAWLYVPGFTPNLAIDEPAELPRDGQAPAHGGAGPGPAAGHVVAQPQVQAGRDVITVRGNGNEIRTGDS